MDRQLVGSDKVDDDLCRESRELDKAGLSYRVTVLGLRSGDALASVWAKADLLVHTSRTETTGWSSPRRWHGHPRHRARRHRGVEAQGVARAPTGRCQCVVAVLHGWLSDPSCGNAGGTWPKLRCSFPPGRHARIVAAALPAGASTVG